MRKKKYAGGGALQAGTIHDVAASAASLVPGGEALAPLLQAAGSLLNASQAFRKDINDRFSTITPTTNIYALGGELQDGAYQGASHATGGIQVDNQGNPSPVGTNEVEAGEYKISVGGKTLIFSTKLKIN